MPRTTPAQESSPQCSCPHPPGARCTRPGEGTSAHWSWTGTHTHTHLARRRGTTCGREGAERAGPLRARRQLPADPGRGRVPGQRGGGGAEGPAASCAVALTTVQRCPRGTAQRAETHHRQRVHNLAGQGGNGMRRLPNGVPHRGHGCLPRGPGGVGSCWGSTVAHGPRTRQRR